MLKANNDFRDATEIAKDGDFRSSDGTHGQHLAALQYRLATEAYRKAVVAWIQYVLDS